MTLSEIQALRTELEAALCQAFSDFEAQCGMTVAAVTVTPTTVNVKLELP